MYCTYMARSERLEIRLSPQEKAAFELAAKRHGLTVSDYLRWCGHQGVFSELDAKTVKRLVNQNAQSFLDMLAAGRAATFRMDESKAKAARAVTAVEAMSRKKSQSP